MKPVMFSIGTIEELLPAELLDVYRRDVAYSSILVPVANRFTDWFRSSGIPFFKFYTDHSERHCIEVFQTALEFITPEAYKIVSAQDLSVLLSVSFCHDAGMHLTELQFQKLIERNNSKIFCNLDKFSWPDLWDVFLEEARRFNQPTLMAIFGDTKPIEPLPADIQDFTDRHRMLIGEFIRRFHSRLAHDLALGLDQMIGLGSLLDGFSLIERDIIGLISRSHGMELRDCFNYVERKFNLRDYNRIHIIYLMILLRLSDYVQIQANRASLTKANIHEIRSPVSNKEWRVHRSVVNITRTHDDPESILIDATPTNVGDFLRIKRWLMDIQNELDKSWAILGELYGRYSDSGLDNLKIAIRRVRSPVLSGDKKYDFLTEEVRFRVAESEMLLLLLAPLYGDHPGYGIRELLQNAHDAVQEAVFLKAAHLRSQEPSVKVFVNFADGASYVEVKDNGVGMISSVVTNYFLNAGASFRSSYEWKRKFVEPDGKSAIVRSGRFGVGVLAAFLVGEKINVRTRHYLADEEDGLTFEAILDQREIEIRRCKYQIGTSIKIDVAKENQSTILNWLTTVEKLFQFSKNISFVVITTLDGAIKEISLNKKDNKVIYDISTEIYKNARLVINDRNNRRPNYVNGIGVCEYVKGESSSPWISNWRSNSSLYKSVFAFQSPREISDVRVSWDPFEAKEVFSEVTDMDGSCSLDLSRTRFIKSDDILSEKIDSLAFASALSYLEALLDANTEKNEIQILKEKCLYTPKRVAFAFSAGGICPIEAEILNRAKIGRIICLSANLMKIREVSLLDERSGVIVGSGREPQSVTALIAYLRAHSWSLGNSNVKTISFILSARLAREAAAAPKVPKWIVRALVEAEKINAADGEFCFISLGQELGRDKDLLLKIFESSEARFIESFVCDSWSSRAASYYKPKGKTVDRGVLAKLWDTKVGAILPWPSGMSFDRLDRIFG
jgi:hypothetical protein